MVEIAPGIWHWAARHPKIGIEVSSYYLAEPAVLLDPMAPGAVLDRLEQLGPPREVLLTNRHHYRDCDSVRERFGTPIRAPKVGMHEFSDEQPVEPYDFGDGLAGDTAIAHEVGVICPDEAALHFPAQRVLAVADGVINYDGLRFVPDDYMDAPDDTKLGLKRSYARLVDDLEFDHLLCAHGEPVIREGSARLREFTAA